MINAVSRAYLRGTSQVVSNALKPVVAAVPGQDKVVISSRAPDSSLPKGSIQVKTGLTSEYPPILYD